MYVSNTCYTNGEQSSCDIYKIINYDNSFSVTRYYPNGTKTKINIPDKNIEHSEDWFCYSPEIGLELNSLCIGLNILKSNDYISNVEAFLMLNNFKIKKYSSIEQVTSNKKIKFNGDKIHASGDVEMHNIHINYLENSDKYLLITGGCFNDILAKSNIISEQVFGRTIAHEPFTEKIDYNIDGKLSENQTLNVTPSENINYKYNDMEIKTKVTRTNGELIYS